MKREYGNWLTRLLWGGVKLTDVEFQLLQHLIAPLPPSLRSVVEKQLDAYNLVQREIDGRALNFYRAKGRRGSPVRVLPLLEMAVDEAPLVRLTAIISGEAAPLHATLHAVNGRVFCIALSRKVGSDGKVTISEIKQAWRSNFAYAKEEQ